MPELPELLEMDQPARRWRGLFTETELRRAHGDSTTLTPALVPRQRAVRGNVRTARVQAGWEPSRALAPQVEASVVRFKCPVTQRCCRRSHTNLRHTDL